METYQEFIERKNIDFKKGLLIPLKDVGREGKYIFNRDAWTFMPQHNLKNKVFLIERLRLIKKEGKTSHENVKVGDVEYRFAYYIVGKIGRAKDKWTWGQFCPIIPGSDFKKLLDKARKERTLLP